MPRFHGVHGAEDSVRLLLTTNPARSFSCPRCQVYGISFKWFPRHWQTVGPVSGHSHCASLAFFKEAGLSSGVTRFACTVTSDEQTRSGSKHRPPAHGVSPCVPFGLESHFGPVWHEWLYGIAPKIIETLKPYHDDNVGTQLARIIALANESKKRQYIYCRIPNSLVSRRKSEPTYNITFNK